ncbi:hypothetical protein CAter282_4439 [Collimonas arenae]|uniref:Uncharacterized protein n=1 Tax=Collimonas arenae TaxID=279058 RepID=A0A127QQ00_9BURK|nr:hypothetical protein CAter10_4823 [Collimonas arenae]AMP12099.1 hypothetical protein CAter282_4439 [Collimonas arenae]
MSEDKPTAATQPPVLPGKSMPTTGLPQASRQETNMLASSRQLSIAIACPLADALMNDLTTLKQLLEAS